MTVERKSKKEKCGKTGNGNATEESLLIMEMMKRHACFSRLGMLEVDQWDSIIVCSCVWHTLMVFR